MAEKRAGAHKKDEAVASPARRASDRGRYGRLSRERVLAAALELVDREGLSPLSMRRLGAELGVEAMALYRYAASKDALLDGLVEALYLELEERLTAGPEAEASAAAAPGWRTGLHRFARTMYDVCLTHPRAVPLLATRMLAVPLAQRPAAVLRSHERLLALLLEAGFDEATAATVFRAFTAWLLGYVSVELQPMVDNPEEPDPAFRLGLHRMSPQELPRLRQAAPALAEKGGVDGLTAGLDALLDRLTGAGREEQ
ncbi:TetR/AcrR family transcriptional regulator C-terminal domain-containing protein [Streptomyces sp. ID05-04B]|uniref:TetR/AcrR family transcriptional regulator n=1 Tax=unclassified Streptomyces TaxID=2593676 RepID=UPI000D1B8393|nr:MULTISPECIES: TetR/AcrR family transcriptional regulator [unclassified Streptomyces]AVV45717.1 TetR family transcriptional regulator [Streptomyces sp. P3]MDX5563264.1 TetR/AcrR family transcriptional regulator C-terminal domain-containing protein [Streptomyces sp. ID05-04B]